MLGITFGAFDLLHAGHFIFLSKCRQHCDQLVIGLHIDPSLERSEKNKPIQSVWERYVQLRNVSFVDGEIIPYEREIDIIHILSADKYNVRFLGSDYNNSNSYKLITGEKLCPIQFIDRNHNFSSTELRERIKNGP